MQDRYGGVPMEGPLISGYYVDHYYGLKDKENGNEYIVLEPYGISFEDLKQLIEQCDSNGLFCRIDGHSQHFTGWTIKITIGKNES